MAKKKKRPTPPPPPPARAPKAARPAGPSKKEQQRAAAVAAAKREALRRRLVAGGLAVAAVGAVTGFVVNDRRGDAELRDALTAGSCEVDTRSDAISGGDGHVTAPTYDVVPPAGGDHLASAARGGVYRGAAAPEDGLLVHSQEHGYVVAWYRPGLPEDQVEQLAAFERAHDGDVIVVEREGLPVPFAATAWGQRLLCQSVETGPLERFFDEHVGNGPEDVPRG